MNPYSPAPPHAYPAAPPYPAGEAGEVSPMAIDLLRQTAPWVRVISILLFLGSGFMILASLAFVAMAAIGPARPTALLGLVYLPLALLYVYPAIKLWAYAQAIGRLVVTPSAGELESALGQQKSFWKFSGITAVVLVGLYGVIVIIAVAVGITSGLAGGIH